MSIGQHCAGLCPAKGYLVVVNIAATGGQLRLIADYPNQLTIELRLATLTQP